jgi:hypothetical protein
MRLRIPLSIVSTLVLSSSLALASPKEADKHFAEGLRLYAEKDFKGAARELALAYQEQNKQTTLFAWAQAERLRGNCAKSRELLSKYIAKGATGKQSEAAFKLMEDCTQSDDISDATDTSDTTDTTDTTDTGAGTTGDTGNTSDTGTDPTDPTGDGTSTDLDLTTTTVDETKPWYRDWIGLSLLGVGAASAVVGGLNYSAALSSEDSAVQPGVSYDDFLKFRSDAEDSRTLAVAFGVGSGLLVGAGIVYILMPEKAKSEESDNISVQLQGSGATLSWASRF